MGIVENDWSRFNSCYEDIKMLYKYRRLIDRNGVDLNEHTMNMIKLGEIKLSLPDEFNDPFDCKVEYKSNNYDEDEILKHMIIKKDNDKIFCLTKDPKNILMWSHYADNHCGVCIGYKTHRFYGKLALKFKKGTFKRDIENEHFGNIAWPIVKVEYDNTRPEPIDIIEAKKDINGTLPKSWKFLSHKSDMWKYEEEYRIIVPKKFLNPDPVYIKPGDVKEITFGFNTPTSVINDIINDIGKGLDINYYKVELIPRKYEVNIVPYC